MASSGFRCETASTVPRQPHFLPQQKAPPHCDTRGDWIAPSLAISEWTPRPKSGPSRASYRRTPRRELPAPSAPARLALAEAGLPIALRWCRHLLLPPARLLFLSVVDLSSCWFVSGGGPVEKRKTCIGEGDSRAGVPEILLEAADDCAPSRTRSGELGFCVEAGGWEGGGGAGRGSVLVHIYELRSSLPFGGTALFVRRVYTLLSQRLVNYLARYKGMPTYHDESCCARDDCRVTYLLTETRTINLCTAGHPWCGCCDYLAAIRNQSDQAAKLIRVNTTYAVILP